MRFGFLVLAACMVFVLGCPQPGSIGGVMDGVRINSFGFDSSTISDKEKVELSVEIENVGAYDTDAKFYVYGYDDGVWVPSDSDSSPDGISWSADGLRGCMMDAKTAGMTADRYQIFEVKPDSVSKGITERYTFSGRLCYKYETRANGMIKAISASQRRDDKKRGAFSQSTVSLLNSYAPVRVELKTKSPVVFYESGGERVADLALVIRNAVGGYPAKIGCSNGVDVAGINKLSGLSVSLDGDDLDCDEDLSLYDGEAVIYCKYSVTSSQPKGEYMLSVVADYYYYVDRSASISVSGSSDEVVSAGASGGGGNSGTTGEEKPGTAARGTKTCADLEGECCPSGTHCMHPHEIYGASDCEGCCDDVAYCEEEKYLYECSSFEACNDIMFSLGAKYVMASPSKPIRILLTDNIVLPIPPRLDVNNAPKSYLGGVYPFGFYSSHMIIDCDHHTIKGEKCMVDKGYECGAVKLSSTTEVRNCVIEGFDVGILCSGCTNSVMRSNIIRNCETGIRLEKWSFWPKNVEIDLNTVENNGQGIDVSVSSKNLKITNNRVCNNGNDISIKGFADGEGNICDTWDGGGLEFECAPCS